MTLSVKARPLRLAAIVTAVCAAALLTGFEAAPSDGTALSNAAFSAAPGAPAVTLPAKVLDAASVYIAYVDRASAVNPAFTDGQAIADSLRATEAYEPKQMQEGITAYAAIVALQDPTFVASVRAYGADPTQRAQVAAALVADPRYASAFHGADTAAGLIVAALTEQGQRVLDTGKRVKQAAYDVQHQKWSTEFVPDREDRLALAKSLSDQPLSAPPEQETRMQLASTGATPLIVSGQPNPGPYSPTVERALAVAAMAALGDGSEDFSDQLTTLLEEPDETECLHSAKLNLYQCLAVAKPHYEDVFCMGQHILMDTGQCIIKGITPRVAPAPTLLAVADTTPVPVKKKTVSHRRKHKAKPQS
jgi:hypothetical protein